MKTAGAVCLLVLIAASCGYHLQAASGSRFADPSLRIDLRPFTNASLVPDAGAFLAGRLREELRRMGFRGAFDRAGADYLVDGAVKEIREDVLSHDSEGFALEHRLTIFVDVRVVEVVKGRLLWKEEGLSDGASYFAGVDFQYTEANRRAAIEEVCRRMAKRIGQTVRIVL
jgi:outer membrane lipopolysaccharide assembly protein LptE/RlpB